MVNGFMTAYLKTPIHAQAANISWYGALTTAPVASPADLDCSDMPTGNARGSTYAADPN
jgi:hypothetical protein